MKNLLSFTMGVVLVMTGGAIVASAQQSAKSARSEMFSWHGELVSFDQTAHTITVSTMAVGNALNELKSFKAGDKVLLGWSGFDKSANAVNQVVPYSPKTGARFTFPAEFVSFDAAKRLVTFKTSIPAESISKLESIKTGQWVTATTPQGARSETQPIVAIKGYNEPSGNS